MYLDGLIDRARFGSIRVAELVRVRWRRPKSHDFGYSKIAHSDLVRLLKQRRYHRRSPSALCRLGIALLLAGYVLFSHGCHGDEDHELVAGLRQLTRMAQGR